MRLQLLVVTLGAVVREEQLPDRDAEDDGGRDDERKSPGRLAAVAGLESFPDSHHKDLDQAIWGKTRGCFVAGEVRSATCSGRRGRGSSKGASVRAHTS